MSKKKYNGYLDRDEMIERRAKKRAMRDDHKENWRFNPNENYVEESGDDRSETESWERYRSG
jgi:hypothetical protein